LKTNSESLPTTDAGSEFQTDGAVYRKERFAKSVRANGWMRWHGGWRVGCGTMVQTCWESCIIIMLRSTDAQQFRWPKFQCCRPACVEQLATALTTRHDLGA